MKLQHIKEINKIIEIKKQQEAEAPAPNYNTLEPQQKLILKEQIMGLEELKTFKFFSEMKDQEKVLDQIIFCYNNHREPEKHLTDQQIQSIKDKDFFIETQKLDKDGRPFIYYPVYYRPAGKFTFRIGRTYKLLEIRKTQQEIKEKTTLKDIAEKEQEPAEKYFYDYVI
jgi:hypothetical protein